jgi:hypothetical protein
MVPGGKVAGSPWDGSYVPNTAIGATTRTGAAITTQLLALAPPGFSK